MAIIVATTEEACMAIATDLARSIYTHDRSIIARVRACVRVYGSRSIWSICDTCRQAGGRRLRANAKMGHEQGM